MYMHQQHDCEAENSACGTPEAALLRSGDPRATEAALLFLAPLVRRWLFRLLGPSDLLDDATQDALTEICLALRHFKGNSALSTFAHRITIRAAYRYFSRPNPMRAGGGMDDAVETGEDPEASAVNRQLLRRIYRYLDLLPKDQRVAFVLCAVEGRAPGEAARIVGARPGTMRSRLKRARDEIQRRLSKDETLMSSATKWRDE